MLNHVICMGRLTKDPEYRTTGSGVSVANFSIACDRDFSGKNGTEKETDFIDCTAWRKTAEFVTKYFTKGRMIVVSGRLQTSSYTDKDGNKRRKVEIVADNVYFGDSKKDGDNGAGGSTYVPAAGVTVDPYEESLQYAQQKMARNDTFQYPYPGNQQPGGFEILEGDDGMLPF